MAGWIFIPSSVFLAERMSSFSFLKKLLALDQVFLSRMTIGGGFLFVGGWEREFWVGGLGCGVFGEWDVDWVCWVVGSCKFE